MLTRSHTGNEHGKRKAPPPIVSGVVRTATRPESATQRAYPRLGSHPPSQGGLRILHIVEAFGGGVFEMVRLLTADSVARGHVVGIAYGVRLETPADLQSRLHDGVELFSTPWKRRSLGANLRACRAVRQLIKEWQPDIVHMHSSFAGVVGASVASRGVATIYTPHAYSFEMRNQSRLRRAIFRLLEAYVSRRVEVVAAVSRDEARLARDALQAPRVIAIENGIPELDGAVVPHKREREAPLTVAMGRISPQRQPRSCARILEAVSEVSDVRWIGGGSMDSPDRLVLQDAGVPITGWTSREDALTQLAEANIYLHWTAWDGQPLSVLEAIARDVIVIAHDIPPLREILGERQVCRSEEEVVTLIKAVLADSSLRAELLRTQRQNAPRYGARRMLAEWHELYEKLATPSRPACPPQPRDGAKLVSAPSIDGMG